MCMSLSSAKEASLIELDGKPTSRRALEAIGEIITFRSEPSVMTEGRSIRQFQFSSVPEMLTVDIGSAMFLNGENRDLEVGSEPSKLLGLPVVTESSGIEGFRRIRGESVLLGVCDAVSRLRLRG